MRVHELTCEAVEKSVYIYGDPEFAVIMWEEVEADVEVEDSEMVVRLPLRRADKLKIEWLGMEVVDGIVVNHVNVSQYYGLTFIDPTLVKYKGWIPANRLNLVDGTRDGFKIIRKQDAVETTSEK